MEKPRYLQDNLNFQGRSAPGRGHWLVPTGDGPHKRHLGGPRTPVSLVLHLSEYSHTHRDKNHAYVYVYTHVSVQFFKKMTWKKIII